MKTYLVGGAVRDLLLGLEPKDKDYVVVDSSVEEMTALGFESVGESFPVFLHPQTKEEYALARREKKVSAGYAGFVFETENVTLNEDLYRRDLTINAMAMDESGALFDPHGGKKDLENKVLRHVSKHFSEDPLRLLRVARFQARYSTFSVHPETLSLMTELVKTEGKDLVRDRVYAEFNKAFSEKESQLFFSTLEEVGFFKEYFNLEKVVLVSNWNELNKTQKWAKLLSDYPSFKKLPLTNQEDKLSVVYSYFKNNTLSKDYKNTWSMLKKLRMTSSVVENLEELLSFEQLEFFNYLKEVVKEYKTKDLSMLNDLELSVRLKLLEGAQFSSWEHVQSKKEGQE